MKKFTRSALLATGLTISALGAKHSTEDMLHHQSMEATDATIAFGLEIDQFDNPGITDEEIAYFRNNEDYHELQKKFAVLQLVASFMLGVSVLAIHERSKTVRAIRTHQELFDNSIDQVHNSLQSIYQSITDALINGRITADEAEILMLEAATRNFRTDSIEEVE